MGLFQNQTVQEDYRDDHSVMEDFLKLIVEAVDAASRAGVVLRDGSTMFPVVIGSKGDWPYLAP